MKEKQHLSSLAELSDDIEQFNQSQASGAPQENVAVVGSDAAMRMGMEFVISVLGCAGVGYALDSWLGTLPLCMVVGFFLGAAAGFMLLFRASNPKQ